MSESFAAKYPGRCAAGDSIEPGDLVRYVDEVLIHEHCTEDHVREVDGKRHKYTGTSLEEMGY